MLNSRCSFAFVEYESRRDADDAYHEMHNKRIGRDDVLKIEVSGRLALTSCTEALPWDRMKIDASMLPVGTHPSIRELAI